VCHGSLGQRSPHQVYVNERLNSSSATMLDVHRTTHKSLAITGRRSSMVLLLFWQMCGLVYAAILSRRIPKSGAMSPPPQTGGETFLSSTMKESCDSVHPSCKRLYGRISDDEFVLSPEQIEAFHRDGCVTVQDVLSDDEVDELASVFSRFVSGEIVVPGKGE
jgi:hypothetical protein